MTMVSAKALSCGRSYALPAFSASRGRAPRYRGQALAAQADGDHGSSSGHIEGVPSKGDYLDVEHTARQILAECPDAKARLDRIEQAQLRVIQLQAAQAQVEQQLVSGGGGIHTSESLPTTLQRDRLAAAADLSAAALEYEAAEASATSAQRYQFKAQSAADKDYDRRQSGLFGGIGAAGGLLIQLPLLAVGTSSGAVSVAALASCVLSSALFGVIWRYVVRNNVDAADLQLKGGCVAAFGLTSGLAQSSVLLMTAGGFTAEALGQSGIVSAQAMLQFAAAAVAIETAIQNGVVSRKGGR